MTSARVGQMRWTGQRPHGKTWRPSQDPPAEVNLGPVLCSGPGTSWVTLHGYRQDTQPVHNPYIRAWVTGPSILPTRSYCFCSKQGSQSFFPSLRETGNEIQDSWNPVLLAPTSLWSLYKCEHLPPRPSSPRPRAACGPGWSDKNAGLCQMGHVPGRPAWAGLEVCVGKSEK